MSVLLKKILIYLKGSPPEIYTEVTDDMRTNIKIEMKTKGSGGDITLKNANAKYVGTGGNFIFGEQDTVVVYAKYTDDGTYSIDTTSSTDRIITMEIQEIEANLGDKDTSWNLSCVDKTYLLLNKLWAKAYLTSDSHVVYGSTKTGWTPPEVMKHIIDITSTTGNKATEVKADFVSNGGHIDDTRPDGSSFDTLRTELSISKVFKPVYEWIEDLSTIERTNTASEQTGTLVCKRPYIFYVDQDNEAHWEYPNTTSYDYEMTVGSSTVVGDDEVRHLIYGHKLKKATFDIVNMIIFNSGKDFFDNGILNYQYDQTTKSPKLKPVYKPFLDLAESAKKDEFSINSAKYAEDNVNGTLFWQGKKYTATYGAGFTPSWGGSAVTSDATLNTSFRAYMVNQGKARASSIISGQGNARWKGTITLRGYNYRVGNLIRFNNAKHGIVDAIIRITKVQHNFSKDGWTTTLTVEEDPLERTNT